MGATLVLVPKVCEHCGKPFMAKTVTTRFCSKECNNKDIKGRKKKEEEKKRIKLAVEKKKNSFIDIQARPFIKVSEASKLFGISEDTIRRMIRKGIIPGVNFGVRLTRVDRECLERFFTSVDVPYEERTEYALEECYTIGECLKKYDLAEHILERIICGYNIPKKQVGNYVYIPKIEIDRVMNTKF
ncbi:helix-turn-helix domain-containing protein [Bacteroides cellulosilyticus]|uniref:helix-turn-helix domain-containing protein n=1 Tax=Bacteroides cellulosilyticus TaxID=246787 RepID=UPI00356AEBEC